MNQYAIAAFVLGGAMVLVSSHVIMVYPEIPIDFSYFAIETLGIVGVFWLLHKKAYKKDKGG